MNGYANLPSEVLVYIFQHYLKVESQYNLLKYVAPVCRHWKEVCQDTVLWTKYDGSVDLKKGKVKLLKRTLELKFSKTPNKRIKRGSHDKLENLKNIYSNSPNLRSVNFTNVFHLNNDYFSALKDNCPDLNEVILNDASVVNEDSFRDKPPVNCNVFSEFFSCRGPKLTFLCFSYSNLASASNLFGTIAATCPNLQKLYAQYLDCNMVAYLPIIDLQEGCPKLRDLRLGLPVRFKKIKSTKGFSNLEVFIHPAQFDIYFSDAQLVSLLGQSPNLKILNIAGTTSITIDALLSLPTSDLQELDVSRSKIAKAPDFEAVLLRWCHSLKELSITGMDTHHLNKKLMEFFSSESLSLLKYFDLSNTKIESSTVSLILEKCPILEFLDLSSCRNVGRGKMRAYHNQDEIKALKQKLISETIIEY